eukprot:2460520-Amphidinium_carterae.1
MDTMQLPLHQQDSSMLPEKDNGLVPSVNAEGRSTGGAVHMCSLHPTHNDAVGIWKLDRAPRHSCGTGDAAACKVILGIHLLMLQEEYDVKIHQARVGNFLVASVIPWNCIFQLMTARGKVISGWTQSKSYGRMYASMDAKRLVRERQKKMTTPADTKEFSEKCQITGHST